MLDDSDESSEAKVIRYEFPLRRLIPKKLWEAQQTEYAAMPEDKLMREALPDSVDWRLRIRFQSLMAKLTDPHRIEKLRPIMQEDIYREICSYEVFKRRVEIPAKAVFISKRLGTYLEDQDALLTAYSTRLWEIASAPLSNPDGTLNIEAAKIMHKTIQILLDRKFGQAVQRQVNLTQPALPIAMDPLAIESKLRQLEGLTDGDPEP